jgi:hypothetical protein
LEGRGLKGGRGEGGNGEVERKVKLGILKVLYEGMNVYGWKRISLSKSKKYLKKKNGK